MRILIITRNAWDEANAIGNTLSNFFGNVKNIELANIYFRNAKPNNKICHLYYRVSETEILSKWFRPQKIGKQMTIVPDSKQYDRADISKKERNLIRFIQKYRLGLVYKLSDSIWNSKKWINNALESFVKAFAPDVVFCFAKYAPQYYLTVKHLREYFHIPLISWIADDEYSGLQRKGKRKEIEQLKYILDQSVVVRGCSEEICEYYNTVFHCHATPLYKGCEFTSTIIKEKGHPFKLIYVGNLLYGRCDIIRKIAMTVSSGRSKDDCPIFEVFSNTPLSDAEVRRLFGDISCVRYYERKEYEIVKRHLSEADIVILAESFERKQIEKTRYSFSTKIIDYLQCGRAVVAVGPGEIASIKYMKRVPGAYVIDDVEQLEKRIQDVLDDSFDVVGRATAIMNYANKYHNASGVLRDITEMLTLAVGDCN